MDAPQFRYRFADVEFDEARLALVVGGVAIELERKPLEVLQTLLHHAGEVVTKDELFEAVWPGRVTVENVLANAVAKLRRALGEAAAARVVTLPRVGYRLDGPLERIVVGLRPSSRLQLEAGTAVPGREHFRLERRLGAAVNEVWLGRHVKTGEPRVYKFSADGEGLRALKREATLSRLLSAALAERRDFVRVIDWNFEAPPFFIECEYGGPNLLEWGDERLAALSRAERLALFVEIAATVAAAHGIGVLHKDLKPANVLVADGTPMRIRLGDFGASRLLEPERLRELGITRLGLTMTQNDATSGTPMYVAPELLRGAAPTVQADVYALGVMLYQVTAGDLRKPMAPGWEHDVDDTLLRDDIAQATDGNPARRLPSVAVLLERLATLEQRRAESQRRADEAARTQAAERALERERARRPWRIGALAVLALGLALSLWFYARAELSERDLARQYAVMRAVNGFITDDLIGAANPSVSGRTDVTVREAAKAAIPRIDAAFARTAPEVQAALHHALQEALSGLSEAEAAVEEGRKAIAAWRVAPPRDPVPLHETRIRLAHDLSRLGRYDEADQMLRQLEPEVAALAAEHPVLQLRLWQARSVLQADRMDYAGALATDRRAWELIQTLPDAPATLRDTVRFGMADSLMLLQRPLEAETILRELVAAQAQRLGPRHHQTLYSTLALANALLAQLRAAEAEPLAMSAAEGLQAALGEDNRRVLIARNILGAIYYRQRKLDLAVATFEQVHAAFVKRYGDVNQATNSVLVALGMARQRAGEAEAAEATYRRALQVARSMFPDDNPQVQQIRYYLADCLLDRHREAEARPLIDGLRAEALTVAETRPDWPARLAYQHARLLLAAGARDAALPLLEQAEREFAANPPQRWDAELQPVRALLGTLRRTSSPGT